MRQVLVFAPFYLMILGSLSSAVFLLALLFLFFGNDQEKVKLYRKILKWSAGIFFLSAFLVISSYLLTHSLWTLYTINSKTISLGSAGGGYWTLSACLDAGKQAVETPQKHMGGWEAVGAQPEGYYCGFNCRTVGLDGSLCSSYSPDIKEAREKMLEKLSPADRAVAEKRWGAK